jgi:hypothetical protein
MHTHRPIFYVLCKVEVHNKNELKQYVLLPQCDVLLVYLCRLEKLSQALQLLTCIRELPSSNLRWGTDYPDSGTCTFSALT